MKEGKSQFGKSRQAQAEYRRKAFELLQEKAARGSVEIKSTFMHRSLLREPEDSAEIADCLYSLPPGGSRVPTLEEHFVQNQVPNEPLPIYRPSIMLICEEEDLDDDEYMKLIDLYRSCLLSKKAITENLVRTADDAKTNQKDTYTLNILSLNLGHIRTQEISILH